MNEVLDTIERELMVAVRRSNARRRRRRTLGIFTGAAVSIGLTAGVGIAAVTDTPIDTLLGGSSPLSKADDAPRVDMRLTDAGGLGWQVTTYRPRLGGIATTTAAEGLAVERPPVAGRAGYFVADNLLDGPLAGAGLDVVRSDGRDHYLFVGTVDADVRRVVVAIGGRQLTAQLTDAAVSAPVERPAGLLPAGEARAERMPDEVSVRTFAVTLAPDALADRTITRAVVEMTLADGSTRRQQSARLCVSTSCGLHAPEAAGQGRAG